MKVIVMVTFCMVIAFSSFAQSATCLWGSTTIIFSKPVVYNPETRLILSTTCERKSASVSSEGSFTMPVILQKENGLYVSRLMLVHEKEGTQHLIWQRHFPLIDYAGSSLSGIRVYDAGSQVEGIVWIFYQKKRSFLLQARQQHENRWSQKTEVTLDKESGSFKGGQIFFDAQDVGLRLTLADGREEQWILQGDRLIKRESQ